MREGEGGDLIERLQVPYGKTVLTSRGFSFYMEIHVYFTTG